MTGRSSDGADGEALPSAEPPIEPPHLRLEPPKRVAGGLAAVRSSFHHMGLAGHSLLGSQRILGQLNQFGGFDCPGCAWPDPDDRRSAIAEYCENGAKAVAEETTRSRITRELFAERSVAELASLSDHALGKLGRLTEPMVLRHGRTHYEPITWDDAFALLAEHLNALASPDEALFYTSGRTSNEAAFLYQLFARAYGTNNLPDCSNLCHESSGVGLAETVGIGKGSVTLEDFEHADTIVVIGQNPGTNHPRMMATLEAAKRRGARIVAVNPLPEAGLLRFSHPQHPLRALRGGTPLADLFLRVQINGDVALLKAIMRLFLEREEETPGSVFDHAFLEEHVDGLEEFLDDLRGHSADELCRSCGVPRADVEAAVELLLRGPNTIVCWAMGLTQHANGVANVREIVNLLLLRGSIGKRGAGTCPVRGHSNVQGDRTMGIHERPSGPFLDRLSAVFGFEPPRTPGLSVVHAIEAMRDGSAKLLFCLGGNFLSATPDTLVTAAALRRCELTAHVSTKLNRSHLVHGRTALILPCLARSERDEKPSGPQLVSVENSMGIVHASRGHLEPASASLLSEPEIVARLAEATLGAERPIRWREVAADYDRIRDLVEATIPGFERFNARVREDGGFYLPNGARERRFATKTGRARLTKNAVPDLSLPDGIYRMMTIRSHDQYNTTIYGIDDRYRGIHGERRVVLMNPEDIAALGLAGGQPVDLTNDFGSEERVGRRFLVVPYDIPRRCVATYFPEANVLVPLGRVASESHTPASKDVRVRIAPSKPD